MKRYRLYSQKNGRLSTYGGWLNKYAHSYDVWADVFKVFQELWHTNPGTQYMILDIYQNGKIVGINFDTGYALE